MSLQLHHVRDDEAFSRADHPASAPGRTDDGSRILSRFNHRCRNALSGIKLGLYLFKRQMDGPLPACLSELERTYQEIERLFDWLQLIYRPLSLAMVCSPLGRLLAERLPGWRSWAALSGVVLEVVPPADDVAGEFDPTHLAIALDALVAWRARAIHPLCQPRVSWRVHQAFFELSWREASSPSGHDERGFVASAAAELRPQSALGSLALPLLGRIISAHAGYLESTNEPAFSLTARWPQFQPPARSAAGIGSHAGAQTG
jgi:hypothetical protein